MRKTFLSITLILGGFSIVNANEMNNPCVYHPNLPGCAGNNQPIGQTSRVINIPSRWGAIYYNAANQAIGYSENNTKGYRSANKEALANCIKAGGGKNPLDRDGEGCSLMTEYRNMCGAIVLGGLEEDIGPLQKMLTLSLRQSKKQFLLASKGNRLSVLSVIRAAPATPTTVID